MSTVSEKAVFHLFQARSENISNFSKKRLTEINCGSFKSAHYAL